MATQTGQNQEVETRTEGVNEVLSPTTVIPMTPSDVVALNCEAALASYSPEEQQEILDLSKSIDVRMIDNVMHYGDVALRTTFEQCGEFLKDERGSLADQEVIEQVVALAKKAGESYEEFNLVLKEPGFIQKLLMKISAASKNAQMQKIQENAVSNYQLLMELKSSCESWLEMLRNAMTTIMDSAFSDVDSATLLEKYIIAGKLAAERVGNELQAISDQYTQTGLQKYVQEYEELKEGYEIFTLKLHNLERSRVMYCLSLGQLALIKRSNRNVQLTIHTQMANSMALMGQQLRNAVLNAKTREVLEGQKVISRLNDEVVKDLSKTVGLTAQETEKLVYAGFYDVEAARTAVTAVIDSCTAIKKTAEEMLPKMKADVTALNELIKELEPHVDSVQVVSTETTVNGTTGTANVPKLNF